MKKFLITIIIILIIVPSLIYIDYFNAKANNTSPKVSLKEETEDAIIYKAFFYRVWYCKTNKMYLLGNYSEEEICPKNYKYEDDTYTNEHGVAFSKRDLQLLTNDGVYTDEMIVNISSNKQVEDAVHVSYNYLKTKYKKIKNISNAEVVVFPEFKEVDGNYRWVYDEEDESSYYCLVEKDGITSYAKYDNGVCGKYERIKMDEKWCSSYQNSTLAYNDEINKLCEEQ